MGKKRAGRSSTNDAPRWGTHQRASYYLDEWFLGAARHELDLARIIEGRAGDAKAASEQSDVVVHRVAAVLFSAAAFDGWLGAMFDEIVEGRAGLPVFEFQGNLRAALGPFNLGDWKRRLDLLLLLWSPGNRWLLDKTQADLKALDDMMGLRSRLIHAKPRREAMSGDPESAAIVVEIGERPRFDSGTTANLPAPLLRELSASAVQAGVDAVERVRARIRSIATLPPKTPSTRPSVVKLDADGSKAMLHHSQYGLGTQVRWCEPTLRYVVHEFAVEPDGFGPPTSITPRERTRLCSQMDGCQKVRHCPWHIITAANKAGVLFDDDLSPTRWRMSSDLLPAIEKTQTACAGACAACLIHRLALFANPLRGIGWDEPISELSRQEFGGTLDGVRAWYLAHAVDFAKKGIRFHVEPQTWGTQDLLRRIRGARGRMGAIVAVDRGLLRGDRPTGSAHSIALAYSTSETSGDEIVIAIDPWPETTSDEEPPETLDSARAAFGHQALVIEWG